MSTINKVPASAGAEWLLAGFALLKRAPVPLFAISIVGLLVVALSLLVAVMVVALMASLPFPLSLRRTTQTFDEIASFLAMKSSTQAGSQFPHQIKV